MRTKSIVIASLLAAAASGTAMAQDISYQGRLTASGPAAAGVHQIQLRVYDAAVGGAQQGLTIVRTVNFAASDNGLFTFDNLDFGSGVFDGSNRWIETRVRQGTSGVYTVLGPRQPVTAAPYSIYAGASGTDLDAAYDNGNVIDNDGAADVVIEGGLDVGTAGTSGNFDLYSSFASPIIQMNEFAGEGARLRLNTETGSALAFLEADFNGEGIFAQFIGDGGSLLWDGDLGSGGTGDGSRLTISGPGGTSSFNTAESGNDSVTLPTSAVSAAEMFDEPGVANNQIGSVGLTTTTGTILSRSITVPAGGYVVVMAQGDLAVSKAAGTGGFATWGVSDSATSLPTNQDIQFNLPAGAGAGTWDTSASAHGLFEVPSAGTYTFYFNGRVTSGLNSGTMFDANLTLMYFPTNYGVVSPNLMVPGAPSDDALVARPTMFPEEIVGEQMRERDRYLAQLEAERLETERKLAEIERIQAGLQNGR